MKKLIVVLSILTIAFAGSAFAQDLEWQNNIGIYLADGSHAATATAGETLDLHMVITGMTSEASAGFELKMSTEGPLFLMEATIAYPDAAINVGTRTGEFIVGYANPVLAVDGQVEVMTFSVIVTDPAIPGGIFISNVYFPSIPGVPSYLADADNAEIVEMRQSTGGGAPVFVVNEELIPVATESTSFDNLKSLYR